MQVLQSVNGRPMQRKRMSRHPLSLHLLSDSLTYQPSDSQTDIGTALGLLQVERGVKVELYAWRKQIVDTKVGTILSGKVGRGDKVVIALYKRPPTICDAKAQAER